MAGPLLEFFRFALYLSMPVGAMLHYGKPEWYKKNVLPYKDKIFPPLENTHRDLPVDQASLKEESGKTVIIMIKIIFSTCPNYCAATTHCSPLQKILCSPLSRCSSTF
ncbi:hypothetical protein PNOK_0055400 [Pyrrhoderma noxium]|uniref:Uncharacterized protein n=1 Tax=Pyrrhoderma noxium TaxID=2282107 RepID=A0A286UV57_9AGAM|nr:hypothetical protein PNOK_0055400 [Pyrrhoderma noxium]